MQPRAPANTFMSFAASEEQLCKCAFHLERGADGKIRNRFSWRRSVISVASVLPYQMGECLRALRAPRRAEAPGEPGADQASA